MINSEIHLRILALSGVFQAASLVKQLAKTSRLNEEAFLASIQSVFTINAATVLDIYTEPEKLSLGLSELIRHFTNDKAPKDPEIARYVLSLLHLERKLSVQPKMLAAIRTSVERARMQALHFSSTHENVIANLASIYTDTISTFSFRIHVTGEPYYLNQTPILNKIRALLLAGIRSAVLWQQMGGRNWQLLISRRTILQTAREWLREYALDVV